MPQKTVHEHKPGETKNEQCTPHNYYLPQAKDPHCPPPPRFPTVHEAAFAHSDWKHIDERYLEGRRRHVLEEKRFILLVASCY